MDPESPMAWPHDENGRPMAVVIDTVSDTVQTPSKGWVKMAHTVMMPIPMGTQQDRINTGRKNMREAEYIVGCERYLLNQEFYGQIDPVNPATGERFASQPPDYDPSSMPPHSAETLTPEKQGS